MFSQILLTVDFDRTLTGPDSRIPQRNLEAIRYFMDNGGRFTVNTGRSVNTFRPHMGQIPVNAPLLLYNGSASFENGKLSDCYPIDLPMWPTLDTIASCFPELNLEVQGAQTHYFINPRPAGIRYYENLGWDYQVAEHGQDLGPFLKFCVYGDAHNGAVADFYTGTAEEIAYFDFAEQEIRRLFGDQVDVFRSAPRILDVHAKGVSKLRAARALQKKLGRKILVCVGDAKNDIGMLEGADYAFCPADGVVASRFENVCPCGEGAVADVIYKKIPAIVGIFP